MTTLDNVMLIIIGGTVIVSVLSFIYITMIKK